MRSEEKIIEQVKLIADDILKSSRRLKKSNGIFWNIPKSFPDQECIYYGSSGIILFLLDTYEATGDGNYLEGAELASNWTISYCKKRSANANFFTGRLGAVFTLLKVAEVGKKQIYKEAAINIVRELEMCLEGRDCDVINGVAGDLIGWIKIRSSIEDTKIEIAIKNCIEYLLSKIELVPSKGVYWKTTKLQNEFFSGFAHGGSGISYLLSQLSIGDDRMFQTLAHMGFSFENILYSNRNWPAVDKGIFISENLDEYRYPLSEERRFHKASFNNISWCNGTTGMCYSRLFSRDTSQSSYVDESIETVLEVLRSNLQSPNQDLCLCHGLSGIGMFLEELRRIRPHHDISGIASDVYQRISSQIKGSRLRSFKRQMNSEIPKFSLFLGYTGIGYYSLQLLKENHIGDNVLFPKLGSSDLSKIIQTDTVYLTVIKKLFPRMFSSFSLKAQCDMLRLFQEYTFESIEHLSIKLEGYLDTKKKKAAFAFDRKIFELKKLEAAKPFLYVKKLDILSSNLKMIEKGGLLEAKLVLVGNIHLFTENWDWHHETHRRKKTNFLIINDINEIREYRISVLSFALCRHFQHPNTGIEFINQVGIRNEKELIEQQIKAFLNVGFLESTYS